MNKQASEGLQRAPGPGQYNCQPTLESIRLRTKARALVLLIEPMKKCIMKG